MSDNLRHYAKMLRKRVIIFNKMLKDNKERDLECKPFLYSKEEIELEFRKLSIEYDEIKRLIINKKY